MANYKVQLKDGNNNLYPNPNFIGIDTSNIIATGSGTSSGITYTAVQDCVAVPAGANIKINGVAISGASLRIYPIALKKGDVFFVGGIPSQFGSEYKIYGLKY